jgi:hypothetical protein
MTRPELNDSIDTVFDDDRADESLAPSMAGEKLKEVADYIDQETSKDSGTVTLSGTTQVLPYKINSCNFTGGKAYLPAPPKIGAEIYVIAVSNNIEISANSANTAKMFSTFNSFVTNVVLKTNQMYRFIYIGFGSGAGGVTDGYWKAEQLHTLTASQITITTAINITTDTLAANELGQKDRNTIIDNGVTNINITVNGGVDFIASYLKHGTGDITFIQGSGRTLVQVSGTNVISGIQGSTATISSIGTTDYLKIANL